MLMKSVFWTSTIGCNWRLRLDFEAQRFIFIILYIFYIERDDGKERMCLDRQEL